MASRSSSPIMLTIPATPRTAPRHAPWRMMSFGAVILLALAALLVAGVMHMAGNKPAPLSSRPGLVSQLVPARQPLPIDIKPASDPSVLQQLSPAQAIAANAAIPFSTAPNPAAKPLIVPLTDAKAWQRSLDCMTAAVYYEAGEEPDQGKKAVAQVVLNRVRDPAYPNDVCDVVFEGSDKPVGCQFTFTCDGSLSRAPTPDGWRRARVIADHALGGYVYAPVGWATHYHADYVSPSWAKTLTKVAEAGSQIFYRWPGARGRPRAFTARYDGQESGVFEALRNTSLGDAVEAATQASAHDVEIPVRREVLGMRAPAAAVGSAVSTATAPVIAAADPAAPAPRRFAIGATAIGLDGKPMKE